MSEYKFTCNKIKEYSHENEVINKLSYGNVVPTI